MKAANEFNYYSIGSAWVGSLRLQYLLKVLILFERLSPNAFFRLYIRVACSVVQSCRACIIGLLFAGGLAVALVFTGEGGAFACCLFV